MGRRRPSATHKCGALSSTITYSRAVSGEGSDMKDTLAQNFAIKHEIGWRFQIDPDDLPAPKTGPIVINRSLTVPFDGQTLQIPPGFTATPFAIGLANPRRLLVLPNGAWWWPSRARAI